MDLLRELITWGGKRDVGSSLTFECPQLAGGSLRYGG